MPLDPKNRVLYGDSLQPPPDYIFDAAIATTFSMDFRTALAVPVSLALFGVNNRKEINQNPLALLEGAERVAKKLVIYADAGHIHAHSARQSRLCALFEDMIVEVTAQGGGAFHPKMWAIRYLPLEDNEPVKVRLLILSRNLTSDKSWDICLTLDGIVKGGNKAQNRPLFDLLSHLPERSLQPVANSTKDLTLDIANSIRRAEWDVPAPFENIEFAANGIGKQNWKPKKCRRLGVLSPFCDSHTLSFLADLPSQEKPIFIGRISELSALPDGTLEKFKKISVLSEFANNEILDDDEDTLMTSEEVHNDLHAKIFIQEVGWDTKLTMGSGNATRPALFTRKNVEIFATLTGKTSQVGRIDGILGEDGFGCLLEEFEKPDNYECDENLIQAERDIDKALRKICQAGFLMNCQRGTSDHAAKQEYMVSLSPTKKLKLTNISAVKVWPISLGDGHAKDGLEALRSKASIVLGAMPIEDISKFVAVRITHATHKLSKAFTISARLEGLPENRHEYLLRSIISNKKDFLRYLRLLLAAPGDFFGAAQAVGDGLARSDTWHEGADDMPLLEDMVRALSRDENALHDINRLIQRIGTEKDEDSPIPDDFLTLWQTFQEVLPRKRGS